MCYVIADATNYITSNLDKNHFTMEIFIDLKKAFNTVDHGVLLKKLDLYGIRGMSTILHQSFSICTTISCKEHITCGVPQAGAPNRGDNRPIIPPGFWIIYKLLLCNHGRISYENSL